MIIRELWQQYGWKTVAAPPLTLVFCYQLEFVSSLSIFAVPSVLSLVWLFSSLYPDKEEDPQNQNRNRCRGKTCYINERLAS
jgi:hypothetical protein